MENEKREGHIFHFDFVACFLPDNGPYRPSVFRQSASRDRNSAPCAEIGSCGTKERRGAFQWTQTARCISGWSHENAPNGDIIWRNIEMAGRWRQDRTYIAGGVLGHVRCSPAAAQCSPSRKISEGRKAPPPKPEPPNKVTLKQPTFNFRIQLSFAPTTRAQGTLRTTAYSRHTRLHPLTRSARFCAAQHHATIQVGYVMNHGHKFSRPPPSTRLAGQALNSGQG